MKNNKTTKASDEDEDDDEDEHDDDDAVLAQSQSQPSSLSNSKFNSLRMLGQRKQRNPSSSALQHVLGHGLGASSAASCIHIHSLCFVLIVLASSFCHLANFVQLSLNDGWMIASISSLIPFRKSYEHKTCTSNLME
ncbi:hypothetical protein ACLKA6_018060 [Drosophila palustris]